MKRKTQVRKADGTFEQYLHNKVMATICNALSHDGYEDTAIADHLADAVTCFLHSHAENHNVSSSEIFSLIVATLSSTGYDHAAAALSEHRCRRRLLRNRIEVVYADIQKLTDADLICENRQLNQTSQWNKSVIVDNLVRNHGIDRQTARAIASMVEEKILAMGITLVPVSLIRQLVLTDAAAMLRARQQLQTV